MIQILAIHMEGGNYHEHIASLRWRNDATGNTGTSTRHEMVVFLRSNPGQAYTNDGRERAWLGVVEAQPPYVRTYADRIWNDNLLALPRY